MTWSIWLDPLAVNDKLRNCTLAHVPDKFVGSAWGILDVNLEERNVMFFQEVLGFATIAAPERGVDSEIHGSIVA